MKKLSILLCVSAMALSACDRGIPPEKARCRSALAQSLRFMTFPANDLLVSLRSSEYAQVPTVFGRGAVPTGQVLGTLVIETSAGPGASEQQFRSARVTNLYCI